MSKKRKRNQLSRLGDGVPPAVAKRGKSKKRCRAPKDKFLTSPEWRALRGKVLDKHGPRCMCCGYIPEGERQHPNVDHIKPRKLFPELALEESNLQVLCSRCNQKKGNSHQTDYRALAAARDAREAQRSKPSDGPPCACGEGVLVRWAGGAAMRCTACKSVEWIALRERTGA